MIFHGQDMIRTQLFRNFQRKISSGKSDDFTPGCLEELDQEKTQKSASDDGDGHPFEYVRSFENIHDAAERDRKSTRLNSSHVAISYAVFCLKHNISIRGIICSVVY